MDSVHTQAGGVRHGRENEVAYTDRSRVVMDDAVHRGVLCVRERFHPVLEDSRLVGCDRGERVAEEVGVVEADACDLCTCNE